MPPPSDIEAVINLADGAHGGLKAALASPTRSLLLKFDSEFIGAQISTSGDVPLAPGVVQCRVSLAFWTEEANRLALPGRQFDLWHFRIVGRGRILASDESDDRSGSVR
jgi:hypothetical protein